MITTARLALDKILHLHDACINILNINHQRLHYINRVRPVYSKLHVVELSIEFRK